MVESKSAVQSNPQSNKNGIATIEAIHLHSHLEATALSIDKQRQAMASYIDYEMVDAARFVVVIKGPEWNQRRWKRYNPFQKNPNFYPKPIRTDHGDYIYVLRRKMNSAPAQTEAEPIQSGGNDTHSSPLATLCNMNLETMNDVDFANYLRIYFARDPVEPGIVMNHQNESIPPSTTDNPSFATINTTQLAMNGERVPSRTVSNDHPGDIGSQKMNTTKTSASIPVTNRVLSHRSNVTNASHSNNECDGAHGIANDNTTIPRIRSNDIQTIETSDDDTETQSEEDVIALSKPIPNDRTETDIRSQPGPYNQIASALQELKINIQTLDAFKREKITDNDLFELNREDVSSLIPEVGARNRFLAWMEDEWLMVPATAPNGTEALTMVQQTATHSEGDTTPHNEAMRMEYDADLDLDLDRIQSDNVPLNGAVLFDGAIMRGSPILYQPNTHPSKATTRIKVEDMMALSNAGSVIDPITYLSEGADEVVREVVRSTITPTKQANVVCGAIIIPFLIENHGTSTTSDSVNECTQILNSIASNTTWDPGLPLPPTHKAVLYILEQETHDHKCEHTQDTTEALSPPLTAVNSLKLFCSGDVNVHVIVNTGSNNVDDLMELLRARTAVQPPDLFSSRLQHKYMRKSVMNLRTPQSAVQPPNFFSSGDFVKTDIQHIDHKANGYMAGEATHDA